jgi:hypothetical protein
MSSSAPVRATRQRKKSDMATLNRYRVLQAILALRQFTVADLAHYSGVKETTVRTVLGRDASFVERDGTISQSRRGGQPIQYRLCDQAESELVAILRQLKGLGASLPPLSAEQDGMDHAILSLSAAEDVLIRQLPQAGFADRSGLISLAVVDYEAVRPAIDPEAGEAAVHRRVVELLLRLADIEQEALARISPALDSSSNEWPIEAAATLSDELEKKLEALGRDLRKILQRWPALQDRNLLPDLARRIGTSTFANIIWRAA